MALLTANKLGVFILRQDDVAQTSPITIQVANSVASAQTAVDTLNLPADHLWAAVNSSDEWFENGSTGRPNIYLHDVSESTHTDKSQQLELAFAATNSTLDLTTSVDEVVAKGTQCKSSTFRSVGAQSFTISVDGLISSSALGAATDIKGTEIFDICNLGHFVVIKYELDTTDTAGTDENNAVYIGQGIIESANISGSFDTTQTYSATIRGFGKLYKFINA